MAIALAARHSTHSSPASDLKQINGDSTVVDGCAIALDLWQELLARTSAAGKVLVQYHQQLTTSSRLTQSGIPGADQELLWNSILKVSCADDSGSDSCLSLHSDVERAQPEGDGAPQPLLKDAAAAITSVVRTVSMHSEASTLHRCASALCIRLCRGQHSPQLHGPCCSCAGFHGPPCDAACSL